MKLVEWVNEFKEMMYTENCVYRNLGTYITDRIKLHKAEFYIHYRGSVENMKIKCGDYYYDGYLHFWRDRPIQLEEYEAQTILYDIWFNFRGKDSTVYTIPKYNPTGDKHGDFVLNRKGFFEVGNKGKRTKIKLEEE